MENLPVETLQHIGSFLPFTERCAVRQHNKYRGMLVTNLEVFMCSPLQSEAV
jgi:hypothetical protein